MASRGRRFVARMRQQVVFEMIAVVEVIRHDLALARHDDITAGRLVLPVPNGRGLHAERNGGEQLLEFVRIRVTVAKG